MELNEWALLAGPALLLLLLAVGIFRMLVLRLIRLAHPRRDTLDSHVLKALEHPFYLAAALAGLAIGIESTSLRTAGIRQPLVEIGVIVLLAYMLLRLIDALVKWYTEEMEVKQHHGVGDLIPAGRKILTSLVLVISASMVLRSLGIEITPILAALGLVGLAVALAFQETLANFFAGVFISLDRPLKVGDYIGLESGPKGYVVSIGWRTTQIRTLPNNLVVIPNAKLAQSIVTNYSLPTASLTLGVNATVPYGTDLEAVEKTAIDVARTVQKNTKGTVPDFNPFVTFNDLGPQGISFSVILSAQEASDQQAIIHAFIKELHARFNQAGLAFSDTRMTGARPTTPRGAAP